MIVVETEEEMEKTNEMLCFWRGFDPASGKVTGRPHSPYRKSLTSEIELVKNIPVIMNKKRRGSRTHHDIWRCFRSK
ncbi:MULTISPECIES: hypothetical protein [Peribacillus]|uniref:hypothetical protein n=1 Tax=Peribacillus TaxID=2675229 RepID=UPI001F4E4B0E|nr:hypothetical protein [Peribacillus sp. Aquil_B1]MCK1986242.1 hypothetical protein [Peribacillus sp. Aquil_B1]